ncbi:MAG: 16S rRNA (cytosine(967)-C(5))-methyltransferase RsmB [Thermoleophilia bacterium]|nr:16S rRNA (cytosine(967)-C(5))-methyltransferase RsmB [Thermoleophilia bacterium]
MLRTFEEGAYADRAFRAAAERSPLDERDRAFAMQLAYGTVQRVRTLDHAVETLGRRPVRKLDPPVRAALRLGAYQLAYAAGVPAHAGVNESVELVRSAGLERAVPFTNAVLRRLAVGVRDLLEALPDATPEQAALKHSYPDWIADVFWREHGRDGALSLMQAQNEPPARVVRLARAAPAAAGSGEGGLERAIRLELLPEGWLEQGLAWPQSVGSQLAGLAVGAKPGECALDLCAAPGGKAAQLAEVARRVVAVEKHAGRARELAENARRLRAGAVEVLNADALALPAGLREFDRALVDAPCSGLGVLASRPDLRWRAEPLPHLQRDLLRVAAERVRPGGTVTYAVCTLHAAENEDVVDATGLPVDDLGAEWPAYRHPRRREFLLTLPHVHGTSGFFVARMAVP